MYIDCFAVDYVHVSHMEFRRILQAAEKGHTKSYIICPRAVIGPSTGPAPANEFFKFLAQLSVSFKMFDDLLYRQHVLLSYVHDKHISVTTLTCFVLLF